MFSGFDEHVTAGTRKAGFSGGHQSSVEVPRTRSTNSPRYSPDYRLANLSLPES